MNKPRLCLPELVAATALLASLPVAGFAQASANGSGFHVEEATIADMQGAIQNGTVTCRQIVEKYLERAKAYNRGVCTALVTADGKPVKVGNGRVVAGKPMQFPTRTVAVGTVLPDLDKYQGLPIEYGRMEATISDPAVMQQYGMKVAFPDAHTLNALETINIRGERSVTCKGRFDAPPGTALPKDAPAVCEKFRQQPDALESAAELDRQYGTKPDLDKYPMYCVVMSLKNWYDAKDMRSTGGNDVNFALDASNADSPDIADLRTKGAIIYAVTTAASTGLASNRGPSKARTYVPNGNFQDSAWGGQACNPYDTSRVPRGTSNGSGVSVSANLATCGICEQTSASCKGPASRNGVVNLLATKGVMMDGGPGYSDSGDRAGVHCRTVGDAVKVLDAVKGFNSEDPFTALAPGTIPKAPYSSFVVNDASNQPLKGMKIAVVREFMVKHVKNDEAISDQIDAEIKTVLRDRLGAELVESVDPLYGDDPTIPNLRYSFADAFREILPMNAPEFFFQKVDGKLEFAVPGWDVTSSEYLVALSAGKAPLSDKLNLRRIARNASNPDRLLQENRYLKLRGDARVTDWAAWVANSKWKTDAQRASAENALDVKDVRGARDAPSYLKMQAVLRMIIQKVMDENGIAGFVNPEQTTPPYKLGGAGEPVVNNRGTNSCCEGFTAMLGGPEFDVPAGFTQVEYAPQYKLASDGKSYEAVTGTVASKMQYPMPISLMVWGGPGNEPALITIASAYEAATHHRRPPPDFGPVKKK
jgi:Asp-tRNA(Asn)/Glu-tRNA(Gln) amidotransferase A subunit family amidase